MATQALRFEDRARKRARGGVLRRATALAASVVLAFGLLPTPALADEPVEDSSAAQTIALEPGTYVEHEAIAYVRDGASNTAPLSRGIDVLAGAQELMNIDAAAAEEAGVAAAPVAAARSLSNDAADGAGRLVLVHDDSLTTEELIAALESDPRVAFAEPNAYVVEDDAETDAAQEETGVLPDAVAADDANAAADGVEPAEEGTENAGSVDGAASEAGADEGASAASEATSEEAAAEDTATGEAPAEGEAADPAEDDQDAAQADAHFGEDVDAPTKDLTSLQWGFHNDGSMAGISADEAIDMRSPGWNQGSGEGLEEFVVAVIDSGVDASNPDLAPVMWDEGLSSGIEETGGEDAYGFAAADGVDSTTGIDDFHGTHVAGIIAADWDGAGTSGLAPNVQLMSVRHNDTVGGLLSCLDYVGRARDAGVDVRIANCSWGLGQFSSRAINVAVTEVGQKGVTFVFGSGNSTADNDSVQSLATTFADNPYVVMVNALEVGGEMAPYSQHGETTTDVMAPGSDILSTWSSSEPAYLGEADSNPVLYESFDGDSVYAEGVSFGQGSKGLTFVSAATGEAVGGVSTDGAAFEGDGVYRMPYKGPEEPRLLVQSNVVDLSAVADKPRYLSIRYHVANAADAAGFPYAQLAVAVKLVPESGYTWVQLMPDPHMIAIGDWLGGYFDLGGVAVANVAGTQQPVQITADMIDWKNFQIQLLCAVVPVTMAGGVQAQAGGPLPCDFDLDSIGLGNDLVPYQYQNGTSMAAPAVAGAAAVIAGTGEADVAGDSAKSAEKLAALVRGAAQPDARYDGLCSTGGYATVDGASNPGPALTKVVDDGENVKIQGWFMSQAAQVQLDGMDAQVVSYADLGDGKAELTVAKPDPFAGGQVTVCVAENGKESKQRADLGASTSATYYDQTDLPIPDEMANWSAWQLVGFAGDLYCLPRTSLSNGGAPYDCLLRYDIASGAWERVELPDADALAQVGLATDAVADLTAATYGGDLVVLISDVNGNGGFFRYTAQGAWEATGYRISATDTTPGLATLASDGEALYLFGGMFVNSTYQTQVESSSIFRVDLDAQTTEQVGTLAMPRVRPQVSYGNDAFMVSGGIGFTGYVQMGGLAGGELVTWTTGSSDSNTGEEAPVELQGSALDFSPFTAQTGQLAYASGATTDGFLIAGAANDANTADTYQLTLSDKALNTYNERASEQTLLAPAATAYNGQFYVLAASQNEPYRVFSATKAETVAQPGDYVPEPEPQPQPQPDVQPYLDDLDEALSGYVESDYTAEGWQQLTAAYQQGVAAIQAASTDDEAKQALADALAAMAAVSKADGSAAEPPAGGTPTDEGGSPDASDKGSADDPSLKELATTGDPLGGVLAVVAVGAVAAGAVATGAVRARKGGARK